MWKNCSKVLLWIRTISKWFSLSTPGHFMSIYIPFKPFISRLDYLLPNPVLPMWTLCQLKLMVESAKKHIVEVSLKLSYSILKALQLYFCTMNKSINYFKFQLFRLPSLSFIFKYSTEKWRHYYVSEYLWTRKFWVNYAFAFLKCSQKLIRIRYKDLFTWPLMTFYRVQFSICFKISSTSCMFTAKLTFRSLTDYYVIKRL